MCDELSASAVSAWLPEQTPWRVESVYETASTNTALMKRGSNGEEAWLALTAEHQTGGKGRLGRRFYSPPGSGIYLSMLLRPDLPPEDLLLLTPATAVAVAETIEEELGCTMGIKWVNDIVFRSKKVCGILTEGSFCADGRLNYAVVGLGINVYTPEEGFPPELDGKAGALLPRGAAVQDGLRARLCAGILTRSIQYFTDLSARRFLAPYRTRSLVLGRQVTLQPEGVEVTVTGIDDQCRLLVCDSAGIRRTVSSGECSIPFQDITGGLYP